MVIFLSFNNNNLTASYITTNFRSLPYFILLYTLFHPKAHSETLKLKIMFSSWY